MILKILITIFCSEYILFRRRQKGLPQRIYTIFFRKLITSIVYDHRHHIKLFKFSKLVSRKCYELPLGAPPPVRLNLISTAALINSLLRVN